MTNKGEIEITFADHSSGDPETKRLAIAIRDALGEAHKAMRIAARAIEEADEHWVDFQLHIAKEKAPGGEPGASELNAPE